MFFLLLEIIGLGKYLVTRVTDIELHLKWYIMFQQVKFREIMENFITSKTW